MQQSAAGAGEGEPADDRAAWPAVLRARRAVVVVDMVESVRLIQVHEADVIDRWRRFVREVRLDVLPALDGQLVKGLGDGLLLAFLHVPAAMQAALAIQARIARYNAGRADDAVMLLRIGIHACEVVIDELDLYGAGVNLAARLAGAARPGDVVISSEARDALVPALDARLADLGLLHLKHLDAPVRAFRACAPDADAYTHAHTHAGADGLTPPRAGASARATVACLVPGLCGDPLRRAALDALCADVLQLCGRASSLRVVSALSCAQLTGRGLSTRAAARLLGADFLFVLSWHEAAGALQVAFVECASDGALWHRTENRATDTWFQGPDRLAASLVRRAADTLNGRALAFAESAALPNTPSHSLLFQAIQWMHHSADGDVQRARQALEALQDRHPRAADVQAWLATWHVFGVVLRWRVDEHAQTERARGHLQRALDEDPAHPLARALCGHVALLLERDLAASRRLLDAALRDHQSEPLSWLFRSSVHLYDDEPLAAVAAAERALQLSPLDPMLHFYDAHAAAAYTAAGQHAPALRHARRGWQLNSLHLPTLAQLIISEVEAGDLPSARSHARQYTLLRPQASVDRFADQHVAPDSAAARMQVRALRAAGLPN